MLSGALFADADMDLPPVNVADLGNGRYRLVAKARAAPGTIGTHGRSKMSATSCEAAKLRAKAELKRVLPNVQHPSLFVSIENTNIIRNGLYCEITMLYDRNSPKVSRKPKSFRRSSRKKSE